MAYTTGQPILFVGTGQTYTDLKNMRIGHIIHSLLKDWKIFFMVNMVNTLWTFNI
jgi:signal recognition particle GTPase